MPTFGHQFISDMIVRKMTDDKYIPIYYDGKSTSLYLKKSIPPALSRHRPDIIAINKKGSIAIGEAKTANDFSPHTLEQIRDFYGTGFKLYIGIPNTAYTKLESLLISENIPLKKVVIIKVPDRLLIND